MDPKCSPPYSQQPANCLYPEPNKRSARYSLYFCKTHFNIMFPSKPRSSECSLSSRFPHQNSVYISLLSAHATFPAHLMFLRLPQYYFVWITNHEAPHYAVFSIFHCTLPPNTLTLNATDQVSPLTKQQAQLQFSLAHLRWQAVWGRYKGVHVFAKDNFWWSSSCGNNVTMSPSVTSDHDSDNSTAWTQAMSSYLPCCS